MIVVFLASTLVGADRPKTNMLKSGEDDVMIVNTKTKNITMVTLPNGEEVSDVLVGDKDSWVIDVKEGNVFIKPSKEGITTNVYVFSKSKVTYAFGLREVSRVAGTKPDLRVDLAFPGEDLNKIREERIILAEKYERLLKERPDAVKKKTLWRRIW
jgi:type IV secretory pathway VirB9-like protein